MPRSIEEKKKLYKPFVQIHPDIDLGVLKLDELEAESIEAKAVLLKVMKMDDEGRATVGQLGADASHMPSSILLLKGIAALAGVKPFTDEDVVKNELPGGAKLSRVVLRAWAKVTDLFTQQRANAMYRDARLYIWKELPKLRTLDLNVPVFVQNLFSELAAMKCTLVLSTNMYDILTSGHVANSGSCYRVDGRYNGAPTAMFMAPNAAVLYAYNGAGVPTGRSWVFFNDNFTEVIIQKPYGFLSKVHHNALREYISKTIGRADSKWETAPYLTHNILPSSMATRIACENSAVYVDDQGATLLFDSTYGGTKMGFVLKLAEGRCLYCGKPSDRLIHRECKRAAREASTSSTVEEAAVASKYPRPVPYGTSRRNGLPATGRRCGECGNICGEGSLCSSTGTPYCANCVSEYMYICADCGVVTQKTKVVQVGEGEDKVCHRCAAKRPACAICGTLVGTFVTKNGISLCAKHVEIASGHQKCAACGAPSQADFKEIKGKIFCPECFRLYALSGVPVDRRHGVVHHLRSRGVKYDPFTTADRRWYELFPEEGEQKETPPSNLC